MIKTMTAAGATVLLFAGGLTAPTTAAATVPQVTGTFAAALSSSDIRDIKLYTKWVLEDIADLDEYVLDGIGMPAALSNLSNAYADLARAAVPPKTRPALYKATTQTLANFAAQASAEYLAGDHLSGSTRYEVIRMKTASLLAMINKGLRTKFKLPTRSGGSASLPSSASPASVTDSQVVEIRKYASRVVEDITALDTYVLDGIGAPGRMRLLAADFQSLADGAAPPRSDASQYRAEAQTLADFATRAANEYAEGNPVSGSARYAVIRQHAASLLTTISTGLGISLMLP